MRLVSVMCLVGAVVTAATLAARQDHHASSALRAGRVMGFDQSRTTHHFLLFTDGGSIDVSVNDPADTTNRDAIRAHLPHIAMMFEEGRFDAPMLVHDSTHLPGAKEMTERRAAIRYAYVQTEKGGRVDIVTSEPAALNAVHQFLTFQIAEHKTGDPATVRAR